MTAGVLLAASDTPLDAGDLTPGEAAQFAAQPGEPRRRLWLVARRALRRGLAGVGRPTDTSDHRFPSPVASLTHSADLAVAAVLAGGSGAGDGVVGLGVDLELDRVADERTAPFFLTEPEQAWLSLVPAADRPAELLRLWTVKEALFKADPGNASTILRDYAVADPAAGRGMAQREPAGGPDFRYLSFPLPRGALSVAVALSRLEGRKPVQTVDFGQMAERISALIAVPVERLTPDLTIAELVPDSFAFIEVAVDLQEEFDVVLSQHDLKDLNTLGDLAALLGRRQAAE